MWRERERMSAKKHVKQERLKTVQLSEKVSVVLYASGSMQVRYSGWSPCTASTIDSDAIGALIKASVQTQLAELAEASDALKSAKPAKPAEPAKVSQPASKITDAEWEEYQEFKRFKASRQA